MPVLCGEFRFRDVMCRCLLVGGGTASGVAAARLVRTGQSLATRRQKEDENEAKSGGEDDEGRSTSSMYNLLLILH